jgi:hypothetical protein
MPARIGRLIAVLLCVTASCRKADSPTRAYRSPIMLDAFTSSATPANATDSIACSIVVTFPIADSIPSVWSGPATVRVSRWTHRGTSNGPPKDTLLVDVPVEIASHAADSLRVTIGGPAPMRFDGRIFGTDVTNWREGAGRWRCDASVPLARAVPGEADGEWYLFVAVPFD